MKYLFFGFAGLVLVSIFLVSRSPDREPEPNTLKQNATKANTTSLPLAFPQLTLDRIFAADHTDVATHSAHPNIRTIVATGDIIPVRMTNVKVVEQGDFTYPYRKTKEIVASADLTFGNLETPLLAACAPKRDGMVFCGKAEHTQGLQYAGIDLVNLANNHTGNHNEAGIAETIKHLQNARIAYTGLGEPAIITVKGKRFGFVGFSEIPGTCCGAREATSEYIKADIARAKEQADVVIVQFHWGLEYQENPDHNQIRLGREAIDAGADLVIGNHPHWVQGVEFYKSKLITYAHGNYVFDQMWSVATTQGVIGKYTFYDNQLIDVQYTPLVIEDFVQPRPATSTEYEAIIGRMKRSSDYLMNKSP